MIPRTFPSTYASNGQQQMVVYFLTSVTGLQRWADYIPVKLAQGGDENSYDNNGYIDVTVLPALTSQTQAWKEYIPVYLDDSATDAWQANARGYIPYGYALFGDASMIMDMTNAGELDSRVTFSRTSNATLVDSAGNLVYAPHNLLVESESFDSSAWTKTNSAVTANTTVAPDGSITADKLVEDTANTVHFVSRNFVTTAETYTLSVYAQAAERTRFVLAATTDARGVGFDLSTGSTFTQNYTANQGTGVITPLGNGLFRCSMTWVATAVTNAFRIVLNDGTSQTYTGDGTSGIFIWGAQLNVGTLQPYYPTTVKNLLGFTQEFDNAGWVKSSSTITANATAAPDGTTTADTFTGAAGTSIKRIRQNVTTTALGPWTYSIWLKNDTAVSALVTLLDSSVGGVNNVRTTLTFATGAVSTAVAAGTATGASASVTAFGNGWYRVSITGTFVTALTSVWAEVWLDGFTSTASETSFYIWGAQLSDSASLDPYVYNPAAAPTSTAYYGPRFDYDPATLAPLGLLIEEQRTNSIRNNTMQGAVAGTPGTLPTNWTIVGAGVGTLSRDVVGTGTATGVTYIDVRYYGTTSTGGFGIAFEPNTGGIAATSGQTWTGSNYIALVGGSISNISFIRATAITGRNAVGGTTADSANTGDNKAALTGTLQRFSVSTTLADANTVNIQPNISFGFASGVDIDITLRIGLPQLELGAFATSVIPTTTAAATRAADDASMIGDNFYNWYNQTEGTLSTEYSAVAIDTRTIADLSDGTSDESIRLRTVGTDPFFTVTDGGVDQANIDLGTVASDVAYKFAGAYVFDGFSASIDGGAVTTVNPAAPFVINQLRLGNSVAGNYLNGHIRRISFFPTRLPNAQLQAITI